MPAKKNLGGAGTHKNPNCACVCCKARRRKAEALALTAGARGAAVETRGAKKIIEADDYEPLTTTALPTPRSRILDWLAMRAVEPNISNAVVAERLGISRQALVHTISRAVREGWLKFDDPISRIEHEIVPKVLDNLSLFLDQKDKSVTIETAKGTLFPVYREAVGIKEGQQTMLALKIETAPSDNAEVQVVSGHVVGRARLQE